MEQYRSAKEGRRSERLAREQLKCRPGYDLGLAVGSRRRTARRSSLSLAGERCCLRNAPCRGRACGPGSDGSVRSRKDEAKPSSSGDSESEKRGSKALWNAEQRRRRRRRRWICLVLAWLGTAWHGRRSAGHVPPVADEAAVTLTRSNGN